MDIDVRIERLKKMLDKTASTIPKIKMPSLTSPKQGSLFPQPKALSNIPKLTSDSQPKIDIANTEIPKLPTMRENGRDPLFTSEMKVQSPYQKN